MIPLTFLFPLSRNIKSLKTSNYCVFTDYCSIDNKFIKRQVASNCDRSPSRSHVFTFFQTYFVPLALVTTSDWQLLLPSIKNCTPSLFSIYSKLFYSPFCIPSVIRQLFFLNYRHKNKSFKTLIFLKSPSIIISSLSKVLKSSDISTYISSFWFFFNSATVFFSTFYVLSLQTARQFFSSFLLCCFSR